MWRALPKTAVSNLPSLSRASKVALDDYTVEIDGGSGDASIVKTLKKGDGGDDGDANVVSNRARDSRTVTPVLVSDEADQEELEDY